MRCWRLAFVVATSACGGTRSDPPAPAPAATAAASGGGRGEPCELRAAEAASWRLVQADGFTFCVPPAWQAAGARTWRGDGGEVTWGTGEYRPKPVGGPVIGPAAGEVPPGPGREMRRFRETIGGAPARLWDNRFGSRRYTGAHWEVRRVYITGEAPAAATETAARQLATYRTVRFAPGAR